MNLVSLLASAFAVTPAGQMSLERLVTFENELSFV